MIINFTADESPRPSPRSGSRRTSEEQGMAAIFICKERKQCLELKGKYPEPMILYIVGQKLICHSLKIQYKSFKCLPTHMGHAIYCWCNKIIYDEHFTMNHSS